MLQIYFAKKIFIVIVNLVLLTGFATCKKQSIPDPISAVSMVDFETRLDNLRKQSNVPGMVAGIIKDGKVIWNKSYGYADIQKNLPVTNSTIFHQLIVSIKLDTKELKY